MGNDCAEDEMMSGNTPDKSRREMKSLVSVLISR